LIRGDRHHKVQDVADTIAVPLPEKAASSVDASAASPQSCWMDPGRGRARWPALYLLAASLLAGVVFADPPGGGREKLRTCRLGCGRFGLAVPHRLAL
jgi:hypothetical protein